MLRELYFEQYTTKSTTLQNADEKHVVKSSLCLEFRVLSVNGKKCPLNDAKRFNSRRPHLTRKS